MNKNSVERIWMLAKVDFKSRYYFHRFGILWALVRPIVELLVYYMIFGILFQVKVEDFELYIFSGLLLWYLFVEGTSKGINVLQSKRYLLESIQFEKTELLISTTLSALIAFCFNLVAFFAVSIVLGKPLFSIGIVYFIPVLMIFIMMIFGVALLLATISIYLKDIQHLWDMIILVGFWITPIVYLEDLLIDRFPVVVYINPLIPIISNMHATLLYGGTLNYGYLMISLLYAIIFIVMGLFLFKRYSYKAAENF